MPEDQKSELIHSHSTSIFHSYALLIILIPSIVFSLILAYFLKINPNSYQPISIVRETQEEEFIDIMIREATISAQIAETPQERKTGLLNHDYLDEDQGMLFVFQSNTNHPASFWMKGMTFPIDILWIDNGKVVQIDANAQPQPDNTPEQEIKLYPSNQNFDFVLEVMSGFAEKNNIQIGTPVKFDTF